MMFPTPQYPQKQSTPTSSQQINVTNSHSLLQYHPKGNIILYSSGTCKTTACYVVVTDPTISEEEEGPFSFAVLSHAQQMVSSQA